MANSIGVVSQKGGVGKSTLARLITTAFTKAGWETLLADLDVNQATSYQWNSRRMANGIEPFVNVQQFPTVAQAVKQRDKYDLIVFDGHPASSRDTLEVAKHSDLLILPASEGLEDLEPQVKLAHELKKQVSPKQILFVLNLCGTSKSQIDEAKDYLAATPYRLTDGFIEQKPSWKTALLEGRALNETIYESLNEKANVVLSSINNIFVELTKELAEA